MADDRPSTGLPVLVMTGGPLNGTAYSVNLSGAVVIGSSMDLLLKAGAAA